MYYKTLHERKYESVYKGYLFYDRMAYLWNRGEINLTELAKDMNTTYKTMYRRIAYRVRRPLFDDEFTQMLYGYYEFEYKPMSNKPVVAICKKCGDAVLCSKKQVIIQKGVICKKCYNNIEEIKTMIESIKRRMDYISNVKELKIHRYDRKFPNMQNDYIKGVLNVKETAKVLGVTQTSIYNHLKHLSRRYGVTPQKRASATMQGIPLSEWKGFAPPATREHIVKAEHCIRLNKPFPECEGHHLSRSLLIYIPKELHNHIRHNLKTGKGMASINAIAIQYLHSD